MKEIASFSQHIHTLSRDESVKLNIDLYNKVGQLTEEIKEKDEQIKELENRLSRHSQNSNQPPSTDQYTKKSKPRSLREKTDRQSGGQPGHNGTTLEPVENPNIIQEHSVNVCKDCQYDLSDIKAEGYVE